MKNVLTLEAMAEWVEKQPAYRSYNWIDPGNCACAQYASHLGITGWAHYADHGFWMEANRIAMQRPWTFGALAARLR